FCFVLPALIQNASRCDSVDCDALIFIIIPAVIKQQGFDHIFVEVSGSGLPGYPVCRRDA
ncbi:MAG: hypothetical protein KAT20_08450, partial [Desulfuromonadales bacterium]|nr:hypothetical protein [Desulfuromonadales bacterium]